MGGSEGVSREEPIAGAVKMSPRRPGTVGDALGFGSACLCH